MDENGNGQVAGAAGDPSAGVADQGSQGGDGSQPSGTPGGQGGAQPDPRDETIKTLEQNVKALNKAIIESRRSGQQPGQPGNGQQGQDAFGTPEGQYAISIQLAENQLRGDLEPVYALYPEVPPEEIQRVRMNPWAFASRNSFLTGDVETAKLEIEQTLLDRADAIAKAKAGETPANDQPAAATINGNPAPEAPESNAPAGSAEDTDPWTMPMDKLEGLKNKEVAKKSQPK